MFVKENPNRKKKNPPPVACNFIEQEALAQVFLCEFWEIFKNSFFYRTPLDDSFSKFDNFIFLDDLNSIEPTELAIKDIRNLIKDLPV